VTIAHHVAAPSYSPQTVSRRRRVTIYLAIAIACGCIALVGFWPTYFGRLVTGAVHVIPIVHLHALVFSGWLLLLVAQATLAATSRIELHTRVGRLGMVYGVLLIVVGEATAFAMFGARLAEGNVQEARSRLFAPVTDLMVFAPFLAAAWLYRDRPEVHKRLIVVATSILLIAAVHRITVFGGPPPPLPVLLLVWLLPIAIGVGSDLVRRRGVHIVYVLGVAAVLFMKFGRRPIARSDPWRHFVDWLVTRYS